MRDDECVQFLQWALPHLQMRWPGFRKVRSQVCKRLQRRLQFLAIDDLRDYRPYLEQHSAEWRVLDSLCRVTISRFYRDKQVFAFLEHTVLPSLAQAVMARGEDCITIWSAGAASGEEPYTIAIIWKLLLQARFPGLGLRILATDADPHLISRSQLACYGYASVKNLPSYFRDRAFEQQAGQFCLKSEYKNPVQFLLHDVREEFGGDLYDQIDVKKFDLVLCRNLVFTYFAAPLQDRICARIVRLLKPGGVLVLGVHETLPDNMHGLGIWSQRLKVYKKTSLHAGN